MQHIMRPDRGEIKNGVNYSGVCVRHTWLFTICFLVFTRELHSNFPFSDALGRSIMLLSAIGLLASRLFIGQVNNKMDV